MEKLKKDDKVSIINLNNYWEDKKGIVISQSNDTQIENDLDITEVKVKIDLNGKNIIQIFPRYCLSKILTEENEKLTKKDFINNYIGKYCEFLGFNYDELFSTYVNDENELTYDEEDQEQIDFYENLKSQKCFITNCSISDSFDPNASLTKNFKECFWDLEFENGITLETVSGENINVIFIESLHENLNKDIIRDYVYLRDIDGFTLPYWIYLDKICKAEDMKSQQLINIIKKSKYKLYLITSNSTSRLIVTAPEYDKDSIIDTLKDELNQNIKIQEVQ